MKKTKSLTAALLIMLISTFLLTACADKAESGSTPTVVKSITVSVTLDGGEVKEYSISTEADTLGDALFAEGLVTEKEHKAGFYTEICGVKTDFQADGSWWCIMQDGEMTSVGMNDLALSNGDRYEIVFSR